MKQGPMALRPRISAGLALSLLTFKRSTDIRIVQSVNLIWTFQGTENVRFGSLAIVQQPITRMSAIGRIAVIQPARSKLPFLDVRFTQ